MDTDQLLARYTELRIRESVEPLRQFWCSMADPNLPEGTQFLGAVVVNAQGVASATAELNQHKLNLGGEIMFVDVSQTGKRVPDEWLYRVMNKEEALNCPCEPVATIPLPANRCEG